MTYPAVGVGDFTDTTAISPADVNLDQKTLVALPASSSVNYGPYAMTQPAYAVAVDALYAVSTALENVRVTLTWTDPGTGLIVSRQAWYIPATTTSPAATNLLCFGRGPTEAGNLSVQISNLDTVNAVTIDWAIWQSSRTVTRHDWRTDRLTAVTGNHTTPLSHPRMGILGWVANTSLAAFAVPHWMACLYAGQAQLNLQCSNAAGVSLIIFAVPCDEASANWPVLYNIPVLALENIVNLSLPRCPVVLQVDNSNGTAVTVSWTLTTQEFAS